MTGWVHVVGRRGRSRLPPRAARARRRRPHAGTHLAGARNRRRRSAPPRGRSVPYLLGASRHGAPARPSRSTEFRRAWPGNPALTDTGRVGDWKGRKNLFHPPQSFQDRHLRLSKPVLRRRARRVRWIRAQIVLRAAAVDSVRSTFRALGRPPAQSGPLRRVDLRLPHRQARPPSSCVVCRSAGTPCHAARLSIIRTVRPSRSGRATASTFPLVTGRRKLVADETVAAPGRQVEKGTPAARGIDQGHERAVQQPTRGAAGLVPAAVPSSALVTVAAAQRRR